MITVMAAPLGGQVVGGEGNITTPDANTTLINQQSHNLAIDWSSFNVAEHELVRFNQPSSSASALNRIYDQNPSQIFGAIRANGNVLLVNPNGIFFGPGASVDVNSLVASGLNITTKDFMAGNYNFQATAGQEGGLVVNQGMIAASTGGSVSLIGGAVSNEGVILANAGQVTLAAGKKMTMDFDGDGLIRFTVDEGVLENAYSLEDAVKNSGEISAAGGSVLLTGKAARDVFSNVVNNEGVISAGRIENVGGVIKLVAAGAGNSIINTGTLDAAGKGGDGGTIEIQAGDTAIVSGNSIVDASSADASGGTVHVLGDKVGLLDSSTIDVTGGQGGGEVLIGGDYQGNNPEIQNASFSYVGADTAIKADAVTVGDGGKVIVWADNTTRYYGEISATGGDLSGDGGFVEVSGRETLIFNGLADVGSETGTDGTILLDPRNLTIQTLGLDDVLALDSQVLFGEPNIGTDVSLSAVVIELLTGNIVLQAHRNLFINSSLNLINQTAGESVTFQAGRDLQINSSVVSVGGDLIFVADDPGGQNNGIGTLTINAAVGNALTGAITFTNDGSGGIALNNSVTSSSAITFNSDVTTGGAVSLSTGAGAGDLLFNGALDLGGQLDITAGTGNVNFTGAVTAAANNLNVLSSATASITGGITGSTGAIDVTATTTNVDGAIALSGAGTVTLDNAVISGVNITTVGGGITFDGATSLDIGAVHIGTGAGGGNILFNGSLDGAQDLDLTAGTANIDFNGAVALGATTINSAVNVTAVSTIDAASFTQTAGTGITAFNDDLSASGLIDITTNSVNIGGLADLSAAGIDLGAVAAGITLTGADGETTIFTSGGDANTITLANLGATNNPNLTLRSDGGVTLNNSLNIGSGALQVNVDNNNSGGGAALILGNGITAGSISLAGSADGGDTLVSQNAASTFTVNGANSGVLANSSLSVDAGFTNLANLTGGSANDSFVFGASGSLSGSIDGGAETTADGINISAVPGAQVVNLQTGTISGVLGGAFSNIETFTGDNGAAGDVLVAPDGGVTITLTGVNDGTVTGGFNFTNFANITGGSGSDIFNVGNSITGTLRGGSGTGDDTFNVSGGATFGGIDGEGNSGAGDTVTGVNAITGLVNIENIAGTGTLVGGAAYVISGADSGTVDGINWSGYSNLNGTNASYGFTNGGAGTLSGTITDGGSGSIDISASSGGLTVNLLNSSVSTVLNGGGANGFSGISTFTGDNVNDTLVGANTAATWTLTGANGGTVTGGFSFTGFANLTGGSAADGFVLSGGTLSGTITGGGGSDTLTGDSVANTWTVTGANAGSVTGVGGGYTSIENLVGGPGSDTYTLTAALTGSIVGGGGSNLYRLDAGGSVGGSITGGAGADRFDFNSGAAAVAGSVDGGSGGVNTLDYAGLAGPVSVTLAGVGTSVGFTGTAPGAGGFNNITAVVGSSGIDTLTGLNAVASWGINGTNSYTSTNVLAFSGMENLIGGTAADTFTLAAAHTGDISGQGGADIFLINAAVTGTLDGGAGADTFNLGAGGSVSVTLTGGAGGTDSDTLVGANAANSWIVTGSDQGTVNGQAFLEMENLTGGTATDDFSLSGGTLSGSVAGGSGGDSLTGDNVANSWNITGSNSGGVTGVAGGFSGIENLTGGTANDSFVFGASGGLSGSIDGGAHTTADSIHISAVGGAQTVNLQTGTISGVLGGTFSNIESFTGDNAAAGDVLVAPDGGVTIALTGVNDGTITGGFSFTNFANLTGGSGSDTFTIANNVTGSLKGGAGDDAFNLSGGAAVTGTVDGQGHVTGDSISGAGNASATTAVGTGGILNIENINGSGTFTGSGAWVITGVDQGIVNGASFAGYSDLAGSPGDDSFTFNAGGSLTGGITGGGQASADRIDINAVAGPQAVNLQNGTIGGVLGATFSGIEAFTGDNVNDTLVGANTAATWTLTGANGGTVTGGFSFTGLANLTGGSAADGFVLSGGTLSGTITGGGGSDTLTGDSVANTWTVTGANTGSVTGVGGGFTSIENLVGGPGSDTYTLTAALTGSIVGGDGSNLYRLDAGGSAGSITGGAGADRFDFNGGSVGNVDGRAGSDALDFTGAAAQTITLTAAGSIDGFTGTSTAITGAFDNIDVITGSAAGDTLIGDIATGGTFNIAAGSDTYVSTNTLIFNGIENLMGAGGADTFNINSTYSGNLTGLGGDDSFNFNAGELTGNLAAGAGNNIYNFNGGNASGSVAVSGDDTWNHATGVSLGSSITGTGSLTVPNSGLGDLIIDDADLRLPGMAGFTGHLIIGGTVSPPLLPLDANSKVIINTSLMTVNSPIITGGDISLLAADINLNDNVSAGGPGGARLTMIAVGDGAGGGNITGIAIPVNLEGGSALFIATDNIQSAENIDLDLGGGDVQVIVGEGQQDPAFGQLDANSIEPTPETLAFLNQSEVTIVNELGVINVILGSGVQAARAVQASLAGNLIALQQLGFIDVGVFEEELTLFGVIGSGIALALAQCEEVEGCAPDITQEELQRLIDVLEARIGELGRRILEATSADQRRRLEQLIAAYRKERQNYLNYQEQLEKYYALEEVFEDKGFGEDAEISDITGEVERLGDILNSAKRRIEWLERLKSDANMRARLSRATGINLTIDALDRIIEATVKEIESIEARIKLLLEGTQAGLGPASPDFDKTMLAATGG